MYNSYLFFLRKPVAKQFKNEVKKILKQIRLTSGYIPVDRTDSNEDILAKTLVIAQKTIARNEERIQELEAQAEAESDRPKVLFTEAVSTSDTSILIGDLAKILYQNGIEIGQKRLFDWLRENHYLICIPFPHGNSTSGGPSGSRFSNAKRR